MIWITARGVVLEHVVTTVHAAGEQIRDHRSPRNLQEEVESPACCIPCNIRPDTSIEPCPTLLHLNIFQRVPYLPADASLRLVCCDLEFDLEKVEGVHAQHRDDTCAQPCDCMVLD